jgi:hypothetical protein
MLFGEIGFPDTVEKMRSAAAVRLARCRAQEFPRGWFEPKSDK